MAAEQNFANHRQGAPLWLAAALLAIVGFSMTVWFLLVQPGIVSAGFVCLAAAVLVVLYLVRQYALKLQNRIIRLEMQTRCARLGLSGVFDRLTMPQVIALRFASDDEISGLMDRALAESLTPDQIKRAVTAWRADHLRV